MNAATWRGYESAQSIESSSTIRLAPTGRLPANEISRRFVEV
jgi:hypothetical protein